MRPPSRRGVDLSPAGFASGDTRQLTSSAVGGSCGGALGVEQVHLLRVQESPQELELRAQGHGFAPVLHVRHGSCTEAAAEVACTAAADNQLAVISLSNPPAGAYYIFVDADDSGGRYELSLRLTQ